MLPRRIAYVLKVFPKISETFIANEIAELRRRGVEVRILSLLPPRNEPRHQIIKSAGLDEVTCYQPEQFLDVLREFRPQLLHAHFATEATAMAIELATEAGIPFTFTAHGYDIHRKAPKDFASRAAAARAVATVSQANAAFMTQTFGVPSSHIRVIPCGVDTDLFRPALGVPPLGGSVRVQDVSAGSALKAGPKSAELQTPLLVCVARLVAVKNLGLLLQSCAKLRDRGVAFRCALVGDGPCRRELEEMRAQLGLVQMVQMPGFADQEAVLGWWQQATVGLLTSDNEGMPVSLMEAAACGVPVVATAVGGIPELVQEGVTGLLVPAGDPERFASALERLLLDPGSRSRMGQAGRVRAEEMFSVKRQVDQLLALWSEIVASGEVMDVFVNDPFGAGKDQAMPTLELALNPSEAKREFKRHLPRLSGENGTVRLKAIRVIRHKPGRRCLIEYDIRVQRAETSAEKMTLIGKVRVRRFGKEGYRLLDRIWKAGFDTQSPDGICVPEPIGFIPRFQMWLQKKMPGETATRLLAGAVGVQLARRIAEAIHKLHEAKIPVDRRHTMADELHILHQCLAKVMQGKPQWRARLERILSACDHLGASLPEPRLCGVHRDFYPEQVIVDVNGQPQPRLFLIDFDLYGEGDPGLDVGNFIGHMTEQSLRELGSADGWAKQEQALEERFIELAGEAYRASVQAYTTLTLVRHIYLSTQFPDREKITEALLELCERRLARG